MTLKGPSFGKMDAYLDDILIDTLDLSNPDIVAFVQKYSATDGPHTVELRRTPSSVAPRIVLDGFRVTSSQ